MQGPSRGVASTHPEGDMGTMSQKSSSLCDSRGLHDMMDEPPLERGQSPSCPVVGRGLQGRCGTPQGGHAGHQTQSLDWGPCPRCHPTLGVPLPPSPLSLPPGTSGAIPSTLPLPSPPPGNKSQMWPRCGRWGSSILPWVALSHLQSSTYPGTCHCQVSGLRPRRPCAPPGSGGRQWAPHLPEGTELARFTGAHCGYGGGARCHRPLLQA